MKQNKMDITFIDPIGATKGFNTGLAYLAGILISHGHKVKVVDLNNWREGIEKRVKDIRSKVVGVSLKSANVSAVKFVNELIGKNDNIQFKICGGPHITVDGKNFIEKYKFDIGFVGESEAAMVNFLDYIEGKIDASKIGNIWCRDKKNGDISRIGESAEKTQDLNNLPFPVYEVFDSFRGFIDDYPLVTSRGCPYKCIYCCVGKVSGKKWRARSINNVIQELMHAKTKYQIKSFQIIDDNFTLDMDRAKNFCRKLIELRFGIKWHCPNGVRADRLDEELLVLMKQSGCISISVGIESGVERVFNGLNKGEELKDIERTIKIAKKIGLRVIGFFIIGIPGATAKDDMCSLSYAKKLGLDDMLFNLISIYPGTVLWDRIRNDRKIRILHNWTDSFHFGTEANPVFESEHYTVAEMTDVFCISNLRQKHYLAMLGYGDSVLKKGMRLLAIIWKCDRANLFGHLLYLILNIKKVLKHVG